MTALFTAVEQVDDMINHSECMSEIMIRVRHCHTMTDIPVVEFRQVLVGIYTFVYCCIVKFHFSLCSLILRCSTIRERQCFLERLLVDGIERMRDDI